MTDSDAAEAVAYYLNRAREGDWDGAFHGLRDLPDEAPAAMEAACRIERDPDIRDLLVAAIGERRSSPRLEFLAEALGDPAAVVWKRALDALVALASPRVAEILDRAFLETNDVERRAWLKEAREQIDDQDDP